MAGDGGWKLGGAIHDMTARARITARSITLPMENAAKADYTHALMERMERELAPSIRQLFAETLADPDAPDNVRAVIHATADPANQFDAVLGLFAVFFGIFSVCGAISTIEVQDYLNHLNAKLTPSALSPADAALAAIKGVMTDGDARKEAAQSGINADRYKVLHDITGEPPAIQELLFLYRRGKVDRDRLEHGIRQSRVRDEWIDAIEALAYAPPGAGTAVDAAVQGHLAPDDARRIVAENGIDPAAFDWMLETAGRPPGPEMLIRLMHRGLMTPDEVAAAIRESDIKNKYILDIIAAGDYIPPVRSIVAMLRAGAIDPARASVLLKENGVRDEDIAGYVGEATHAKAAAHRTLTEANILTAYRDRVIGRTDAHDRLVALSFSPADADWLLDLEDGEAAQRLRTQVIATTRAKYVAHHLDASTASATLDAAHVDPAQRDQLLAVWALERDATTAHLTPAVMTKGVKNGALTWDEFVGRMVALGYSDADARLYGRIEGIEPAAVA